MRQIHAAKESQTRCPSEGIVVRICSSLVRQVSVAILVAIHMTTAGCSNGDSHASHPGPPAKIIELNKEQSIATLQLEAKAVERLDIGTAETEEVQVARRRSFGGELRIPPGQTATVVAPIAGTVMVPKGAKIVVAGSTVTKDQVIFDFRPLSADPSVLTPADRISMANAQAILATSQIEASREVESARLRMDAAKIAYDRAKQLLEDEAGSQRTVDETKAQFDLTKQAHTTATERDEYLSGITLDVGTDDLTIRKITAGVGGVVQSLAVAPGETVAAGDPLFDVANLDRLWVRVPVYVGYRNEVDIEQEAVIRELGKSPQKAYAGNSETTDDDVDIAELGRSTLIAAPHIADPNASSVDFYYEIENEGHRLYPGQRVTATLTMQAKEKSLVVPWKAVLFDIHGFAWVYVETAEHTYERRRIEIKYIDNERAILAAGPKPGSNVVTNGAAELFGREFYYIIKPGSSAH